ncbi:hypothetical protein [Stenotrophomonas muris]|uniref:hypothetical protein n=1 Tax=Stenotrophomonas muris TaxID=2963283 RepID=UPI0039C7366B
MDKITEIEVLRVESEGAERIIISVVRWGEGVNLYVRSDYGTFCNTLTLLHSEAVTIGEQLIAAGKAEG